MITSGPYRFVRHPIYTGVLSLLLADLLLVGTVYSIIGFLVIAISFYIKLKLEEKYMLTQFPHEYPAYMKKVKRLIPFVF